MSEQQLCLALQDHLDWEPEMVESIVASLKQAAVRNATSEIEDIVQNYMNGDALCRAAVEVYTSEVLSNAAGPGFAPIQPKRRSTDAAFGATRSAPDAQRRSAAAHMPGSKPSRAPTGQERSAAAASQPPQRAAAQAPTGMAAVRSAPKAGKSGKGKKAPPVEAPFAHRALAALERRVFNCLKCGKVHDCREATQEALELMELRGACTFCGSAIPVAAAACAVAARQSDAAATPSQPTDAASSSAAPPDAQGAAEAAAQKAQEFKNRMLEYDRTAAKRTAVIDDQGDFYEIESNAWLTPEERAQMKAQVALEDKGREERKNRLVVSVDLIGRRVITENPEREHSGVTFERDEARSKAATAAAATRAGMPEGGGTAARAAEAAAAGTSDLRHMRLMPAAPVGSTAPVFLPAKAAEVREKRAGKSKREGPAGLAAGLPRTEARGVWANRTQKTAAEDDFDQFAEDVDVLFQETLAAEAAADEEIARQQAAAGAAGAEE